ncbi:outer membrane scaffolding protein for murein synthesis (MipA/OmpV family) [Acidovorax sp. 56]|uniref:MipA/OmpV family protein n=1 Tax=Acidovorax sp. 56 TaxID=2035205 RepID=UPI000C16613F|nr:outer membrane scaffolding protein for murein synthesis (MipA/OmpV family) [Acidovorax sp. 56]
MGRVSHHLRPRLRSVLAWVCCGASAAALAQAAGAAAEVPGAASSATVTTTAPQEAAPAPASAASKPTLNYVLGGIVGSSPDYAGGAGRSYSLRPAWALEYGRFRLSTSRGSALMGHGLAGWSDSGASATLAQSDRFALNASLRIDQGDDGSDSPMRRGLPEVRSTLRARLSAGYALTPRWSVGAGVSQDILGRDGGMLLSTNLGYSFPYSEQTRVSFGVGASFADRQYLRSHFGVPTSAAGSTSPLPAFDPHAGLYSVDAGVDVMVALSRHWVALGGVRVSQLQGDARRSPLTVQPVGYSASVGLAYRCCR